MTQAMAVEQVAKVGGAVIDRVEEAVVGKRDVLELVLVAVLARGHVLVEDFPGLAKTLIARSFGQALGLEMARLQFTPDLMPGDVTGSSIWDQHRASFDFRPGPVFTNVLLGDEINRTPPKTQSALLEAMAERQVTVEGTTRALPDPFVVLATQNPLEYEGTYPLPEAQLDRFLFRVSVGYPSRDDEAQVLAHRVDRRQADIVLEPVVDRAAVVALQEAVETVHVAPSLRLYMVDLVAATRRAGDLEVGSSPRGSLALLQAGRARAALAGRDFVTPDDVKAVAVPALAHRVTLRPELWVRGVRPERVVRECLGSVATPPVEE